MRIDVRARAKSKPRGILEVTQMGEPDTHTWEQRGDIFMCEQRGIHMCENRGAHIHVCEHRGTHTHTCVLIGGILLASLVPVQCIPPSLVRLVCAQSSSVFIPHLIPSAISPPPTNIHTVRSLPLGSLIGIRMAERVRSRRYVAEGRRRRRPRRAGRRRRRG